MPGKVRRIVTGVNAAGRSCILSDTRFPTADVAAGEPVRVGLWTTEAAPASNTGTHDPVPDGVIVRTPPAHRGGSVVRITDIPPERAHAYDPHNLRQRGCKTTPDRSARHPGFHATDTVDYAICLEGEVWAVLDEDETLMRPGDVLIQRGTYHAWANRSDTICRMAFILIDATPLENH
jgi:quercetin dioxygenase-like cupin family protein